MRLLLRLEVGVGGGIGLDAGNIQNLVEIVRVYFILLNRFIFEYLHHFARKLTGMAILEDAFVFFKPAFDACYEHLLIIFILILRQLFLQFLLILRTDRRRVVLRRDLSNVWRVHTRRGLLLQFLDFILDFLMLEFEYFAFSVEAVYEEHGSCNEPAVVDLGN